MAILIDGYNLLNDANIVAEGPGAYSLEKSRQSLLRFLISILSAAERRTTIVVFDGKEAPPGLSRTGEFAGITVMFSQRGTEADDLIEELLLADSAPRRLTVVSSDHRLHRAAARRQATAVDSDVWCRERVAARRSALNRPSGDAATDLDPLEEDEVARWLAEFGPIDLAELEQDALPTNPTAAAISPPAADDVDQPIVPTEKPTSESFFNPFPKGYGEDLLDED